MITKQHVIEIQKVDQNKSINSYKVYHGLMFGLDNAGPDVLVHTSQDISTYHGLVIDEEKRGKSTLKDIISGVNTGGLVAKINSSNPEEIEKFIQKYLDKDFKFT